MYTIFGAEAPTEAQEGSFSGSVAGGKVNATFTAADGSTFTMTGTRLADGSYQMTRSDQPGTTLLFTTGTQVAATQTRSTIHFHYNFPGLRGNTTELVSVPTSYRQNGVVRTHEGTLKGRSFSVSELPNGIDVFWAPSERNMVTDLFEGTTFDKLGTITVIGTDPVISVDSFAGRTKHGSTLSP